MKINELFCIIENKELFLFDLIIDLNDENIVFICRNENNFYLCIRQISNHDKIIVTFVSLDQLLKFLSNELSVQEILLSGKEFYELNGLNNSIKLKESDINLYELPFLSKHIKLGKGQLERYMKESEDDK